jgi:hypothetical protein
LYGAAPRGAPDHETAASHEVETTVSGGVNGVSQTFAIAIGDVMTTKRNL